MLIHHFVVITILLHTVVTGVGANELLGGFAVAEVSNPCNLGRNQLKFHDMDDTNVSRVVGGIFSITFFIARFIVFPMYFAEMVLSTSTLFMKFIAASLWFVSWHWLLMIVNLMVKALYDLGSNGKSSEPRKGGIAWLYGVLKAMRGNKVFLGTYYAIAGLTCYVPLAVFHESVIMSV